MSTVRPIIKGFAYRTTKGTENMVRLYHQLGVITLVTDDGASVEQIQFEDIPLLIDALPATYQHWTSSNNS